MILAALVEELARRFQHEKRAKVCLWFDEKREFDAILPKLNERLATHQPAPFTLLQYEPAVFHGQIWLKDQVRRSPAEHHFVVYLPLAEDRLDSPDSSGEHYLELLAEYRIAGITWRLNGKQPTLFSFLRQASVELPESPVEQRGLYEGGGNSLLAKYAAKFADRPASFWQGTLTAERAQERLIGDLEKTILDVAAEPEVEWKALETKCLVTEFTGMVCKRYGYESPGTGPAAWVRGLVEMLALTETYLGYREPADFPFADRLPSLPLREHHLQLLGRWLRDAESRPIWDRWIAQVESSLDLSEWAAAREGLSFGLPHLVALRWQRTIGEFEKAAQKTSLMGVFFDRHRTTIRREVEFGKASPAPALRWTLLASLDGFLAACREAENKVEHANSIESLAQLYSAEAARVDGQHLRLRFEGMNHSLPTIGKVADRAYARYTNLLNEKFFAMYASQQSCEIPGLELVTSHLEREVWKRSGRRAVIIADALRLDAAFAIRELLKGQSVEIHSVRAMLPTVTPIGMTALLPLSGANVAFEVDGTQLRPRVNGKDASARSNRLALLSAFGGDCREIEDTENTAARPDNLGDLLVVFGHETVDHLGHGSGDTLVRHVDLEIERLAILIRKLHLWGYPEVHVVTDHGFVLLDDEQLPPEVKCDKAWCLVRKERFALVRADADLPLATKPFAWDDGIRVALPPGLAFFATEKSFSHGGAALQEMVIPHLVSKMETQEKRIGVEAVVPSSELMRSSVKVILRPRTQPESKAPQLSLFVELGRTLQLDVLRRLTTGERKSVLATGHSKEVRIEADTKEVPVNLFFHTAESFRHGETLELDIRDMETSEQFPPGGIKLTVGRDM